MRFRVTCLVIGSVLLLGGGISLAVHRPAPTQHLVDGRSYRSLSDEAGSKPIDATRGTLSVSIAFVAESFDGNQNLFQTSYKNSGLRAEITDKGSLSIIAGDYGYDSLSELVAIQSIEIGREYTLTVTVRNGRQMAVYVDGNEVASRDRTLPRRADLPLIVDEIREGNGYDGTRPFRGEIHSFSVDFTPSPPLIPTIASALIFLAGFTLLVVIAARWLAESERASRRTRGIRSQSALTKAAPRVPAWALLACVVIGVTGVVVGARLQPAPTPVIVHPVGAGLVSPDGFTPAERQALLSSDSQDFHYEADVLRLSPDFSGSLAIIGLDSPSGFGRISVWVEDGYLFSNLPILGEGSCALPPSVPFDFSIDVRASSQVTFRINGGLCRAFRMNEHVIPLFVPQIISTTDSPDAFVAIRYAFTAGIRPAGGLATGISRGLIAFGALMFLTSSIVLLRRIFRLPSGVDPDEELRGLRIVGFTIAGITATVASFNFLKFEDYVHYFPRNTFLWARAPQFSDYYELSFLARIPDRYSQLESNYPPAYWLFQKLLNLFPGDAGFIIFMALSAIALIWWSSIHLGGRMQWTNYWPALALIGSYPVLFAVTRGNSDLLIMGALGMAAVLCLKRKWFWAGLVIGVVGALKISPLIFVALLIWKSRRSGLIGAAIGVTLATLGGLAATGFDNPLKGLTGALASSGEIGQRTNPTWFSMNGSALAFLQQVGNLVNRSTGHITVFDATAGWFLPTLAILSGLGLLVFLSKRPPLWSALCLISCAYVIVPPISFDYRLTVLLVPAVVAVIESRFQSTSNPLPSTSWWLAVGLLLAPRTVFHTFEHLSLGGLTTTPLLAWLAVQTVLDARKPPPAAMGADVRSELSTVVAG